jgi:hypothetical protein
MAISKYPWSIRTLEIDSCAVGAASPMALRIAANTCGAEPLRTRQAQQSKSLYHDACTHFETLPVIDSRNTIGSPNDVDLIIREMGKARN